MFRCNHCPFVIHVIDVLAERAGNYARLGVEVVGINANDVTTHESDSPEHMKEFEAEHGVGFPYLYDETQETAKAFKAACAPDLTAAVHAVAEGRSVSEKQIPSVGCNIKWKAGNAPEYGMA